VAFAAVTRRSPGDEPRDPRNGRLRSGAGSHPDVPIDPTHHGRVTVIHITTLGEPITTPARTNSSFALFWSGKEGSQDAIVATVCRCAGGAQRKRGAS
jgi:hypothetical protein